jgi:hypothetical protein
LRPSLVSTRRVYALACQPELAQAEMLTSRLAEPSDLLTSDSRRLERAEMLEYADGWWIRRDGTLYGRG